MPEQVDAVVLDGDFGDFGDVWRVRAGGKGGEDVWEGCGGAGVEDLFLGWGWGWG